MRRGTYSSRVLFEWFILSGKKTFMVLGNFTNTLHGQRASEDKGNYDIKVASISLHIKR